MGEHKSNKFNRLAFNKMLAKLNDMYDEEAKLIREGQKIKNQYDQLQEDKELLQMMIMYASNKNARQSKK